MPTDIYKSDLTLGNARFSFLLKGGFFEEVLAGDTPLHSHPNFEVHQIRSGALGIRFQEGLRTFPAGSVVMIPPHITHAIEKTEENTRRTSFEFSLVRQGEGSAFAEYSALLANRAPFWSAPGELRDLEFPEEVISGVQNHEIEFIRRSKMGLALLGLFDLLRAEGHPMLPRRRELPENVADRDVTLSVILDTVQHGAAEKLTLSDVANAVHLSPRQVERILRAQMHEPFLSILNRYRVELAVSKFSTSLSLEEIAASCGFPSYASFWKAFRRFTGASPAAARKKGTP